MPVFLDLDNTLVDRDGAFLLWAQQVVPSWGGDAVDIDWLVRADDSGYTGRADLALKIIERLRPVVTDVDQLVASMRAGLVEHLECFPGVLQALDELVAAGQPLVIVTNGEPRQQRAKLERTGLNGVTTGAVISGDVGFKKPDPRIFEAAYALAGKDGIAWMVGDNATADIAGARALGWKTTWVSHEQVWQEAWTPTLTAREPADALLLVREAVIGVC